MNESDDNLLEEFGKAILLTIIALLCGVFIIAVLLLT